MTTNSRPFISIITPVFNAEAFIGSCIEKVQQQNCKNFEHIIIDGKSSDNTLAVIKRYANEYTNIVFLSEKDNGVYDAMNKGVKLAKGRWLYFLGCDDYFSETDILEKISAFLLQSSSMDIIYGDAWVQRYNRIFDGVFDVEKILRHNICHQAVFYKKEVFEIMGVYKTNYKQEADYAFNLGCWLSGKITCQYVPLTIAVFADGGVSSLSRDEELVKDYPMIVANAIGSSQWPLKKKVYILSVALWKILLRYGGKVFFGVILKMPAGFFVKWFAAFFMFLLVSYRYLITFFKRKNKVSF